MTTQSTGDTTANRQRARSLRGIGRSARGSQVRLPSPPRQRRPGLAALAVLLIVGGALAAFVLASQLDERVEVIAAKRSIPAGKLVTAADFNVVKVAAEGVPTITREEAEQNYFGDVAGPQFARTRIAAGQLIAPGMLDTEAVELASGDYAIVSVLLTPGLVPESEIRTNDVVMVIQAAGESGNGSGRALTEGYVLDKVGGRSDDFGGGTSGSVNLLVPQEAAEEVVDAAGSNRAGLAIISRNNSIDDLSLAVAGSN